jgi:hypothetical protein
LSVVSPGKIGTIASARIRRKTARYCRLTELSPPTKVAGHPRNETSALRW